MRTILFLFIIFSSLSSVKAQVGIYSLTPNASAALHVITPSNDKGVLLPRLTDIQIEAVAVPATGLILYDLTNNVFKFFDGLEWKFVGSISSTTDPTTIPFKDGGDIYYNSNTQNMNFYNGTAWRKFTTTGLKL